MPLTDKAVRAAKAAEKPYKVFDGEGMYLLVNGDGGKYWRLKYRFAGKEKLLALGVYPVVPLAEARQRRAKAKAVLMAGRDPAIERQTEKRSREVSARNTFEAVAREWHEKFKAGWSEGHAARILHRLETDVFPWIGSRPFEELEAADVLQVLRRIESRGAIESAHRVMQNCGQVFRYAVATGRAKRDPTRDLRGALPPAEKKSHASLKDPKAIGPLLKALSGYQGTFVTKCALRLAPLVFVRPGELRKAEWAEFDLEKILAQDSGGAEWRIPAERMKMKAPHIVPLSRQAIQIVRELHAETGGGRFLFPGARSASRTMSENTINAALRRLDYGTDEMTGHGFRSMASTLLNEGGWNRDAIERQLAHAERDNVRAAYNYAEYLPERRQMMQAWADYLDELAAGGRIIPMRQAA
jgi:integrase